MRPRVSIFLSIFNVHVNRSPVEGTITEIRYRKGKYRAAYNDLASVENETKPSDNQRETVSVSSVLRSPALWHDGLCVGKSPVMSWGVERDSD